MATVARHMNATVQGAAAENVLSPALRRLRLRRHARNRPRGFKADLVNGTGQHAAETIDLCAHLVEAMRHWYAKSAVHDRIAQVNLARLAVLR